MNIEKADAVVEELETKCKRLEQENELLLQQLQQVQDELKRQYQLNPVNKHKSVARDKAEIPRKAAPSDWKFAFYKLACRAGLTAWGQAKLIGSSEFFDKDWYLKKYPDVAKNKLDPAKHYLKYGAKEGRDPGPFFNAKWYLNTYPDVAQAGANPLLHYLLNGKKEQRKTQPIDSFANEGKNLIKVRDEQAQLAAELQKRIAQITRERDKQSQLATERLLRIEQITQAWNEQISLTAEKHERLEQITKAWDEQAAESQKLVEQISRERDELAKKADQHAKRAAQLEVDSVDFRARQQLLDQEMIRAEAQIDLIKDVLLREPGL